MRTQSERVYLMKRDFMNLHKQGLSITEIAEKFNLSFSTVYSYLQEIADSNGVTRQSLLQRVYGPRAARKFAEESKANNKLFEECIDMLVKAEECLNESIEKIDKIILQEEEKKWEK